MNYYVDGAGLEIVEKNIYTAIEIVTLLPMHGKEILNEFMMANGWVKNYYPHCEANNAAASEIRKRMLSRIFEKVFSKGLGEWLDNRLMKITERRWNRKMEKQMKNKKGVALGMVVDKHFSKPNPFFFQDKVLEMYLSKINDLPRIPKEVIRME